MVSSSEHPLLPSDLVEEILCKIPIEYLIRFRLVCKEWYSFFKNKRFIYTYSDFVHERFIRIDKIVQIINPVTQTRLISPLPGEFHERPWIKKFLHCDGLVLLKFKTKLLENQQRKLAIWNPILGQIKWIQPRVNPGKYKTYGIGYNNANDYKILRFFNGIDESDNEIRESYEVNLEIYDLKSNSWSIIDVSLDWARDLSCKGVSVNGNMYWKALWNTNQKLFIQSFDFSSQTFKPRSYTLPFESCRDDTIALSCFRRDKLSLLHQISETKKIEVWISNKVNEEVNSWSKYLSFDSSDLPLLNVDFNYEDPDYFIDDENDKIRVWCNEMTEEEYTVRVSVYEIGKDGIKREVEIVNTEFFFSYVYVPSLVHLPG